MSDNTLSSYGRDMRRYQAYLEQRGITDIAQVREEDVASFLAHLRTSAPGEGDAPGRTALSASSAARTLIAVRGLHRFLLLEGVTQVDPAREVRPPAVGTRLPKAIRIDEVERLLEASSVGDPPVSLRDRALLEVVYATGARISEAVGLDLDDLPGPDVPEEEAAVRLLGKGGKERLVPLGSFAREAIGAYVVRARPLLAAKGSGAQAPNPYGAALAWPEGTGADGTPAGHRPARKAGAAVVLHGGRLALYVERGGKSLLSFSTDPEVLGSGARALAEAFSGNAIGGLHIQRADGDGLDVHGPLGVALSGAGFRVTPRGLRLR